MRTLVPLLVAVAGATSCAPEVSYFYHPAELATATVAGRPAARYGVPPESPRGSVRVATFGVRTLQTSTAEIPTLRVRLTIANNNDTGPWRLDADELRVAYASGDTMAPVCAHTGSESAPRVEIAPGEQAVVDAWFPLPPGAEGAASIPRFDVLWEVSTPEREVAERTPFERVRLEPELAPSPGYVLGPGPAWWYDPLHFTNPPVVVHERPRVYGPTPR